MNFASTFATKTAHRRPCVGGIGGVGGWCAALVASVGLLCTPAAWAAHAFALFGDIKYPVDFKYFDYVNPNAPKGGEMALVSNSAQSNFDRYNPFIVKGDQPPGLAALLFETLMTGSMDEPATVYGLLADDVQVAPDKMSAQFHLNPKARFQNGDPVLAADVKYSFERLSSLEASPGQRIALSDIKSVTVVAERMVRFDFKRADKVLVLIAAGMPVFSHLWGAGKKFDEVVTDRPIVSGPYRIGRVNFGKDITYDRDPTYWGWGLPVQQGSFNFDHLTYKIYTDDTVRLEAFKAGEFDLIQENIARRWARQYTGARFKSGDLVKREFATNNPGSYQGYVFNLRRPLFQDVRVREAFALALDFDWMNRQLFYGAYKQYEAYFANPDYIAQGLPKPDELALLTPLRPLLSPAVFGELPLQPSTKPPRSLRANLLQAQALLAQSGWQYRDGALRNAKGEAMEAEMLYDQPSLVKVLTPYVNALKKLGINLKLRASDRALTKKRLDNFDFDMTSIAISVNALPNVELKDLFGSESGKQPGGSNLWGIQDKAVDSLLNSIGAASTRSELSAAVRSLDRVLAQGHYSVHNWYSPAYRVAYAAKKFGLPSATPAYYGLESWAIGTWWATGQ